MDRRPHTARNPASHQKLQFRRPVGKAKTVSQASPRGPPDTRGTGPPPKSESWDPDAMIPKPPSAPADSSRCSLTSEVQAISPTRPHTARTGLTAAASYRHQYRNGRCLSASTESLNRRMASVEKHRIEAEEAAMKAAPPKEEFVMPKRVFLTAPKRSNPRTVTTALGAIKAASPQKSGAQTEGLTVSTELTVLDDEQAGDGSGSPDGGGNAKQPPPAEEEDWGDMDEDEIALALLKKDPSMGYDRFFVPISLVEKRLRGKLAHYREHPQEMDLLEARVQRSLRAKKARQRAAFLATLEEQRKRRIGRNQNTFEKLTSGTGAREPTSNLGGSASPANPSSRRVSIASPRRGSTASVSSNAPAPPKSEPFFKTYLEKMETYGTAGYRQVRTTDQLVAENNRRVLEQRRRVVEEAKALRARKEAAINRHEEWVEAAENERKKLAMQGMVSDWMTIIALSWTQKALYNTRLKIESTKQGLGCYEVMMRYFNKKWRKPAEDRLHERRMQKVRGAIKFALCAARMYAYIEVRRASVGRIALFVDHLNSAGTFAVRLHQFRLQLLVCQRVVRRFLHRRLQRLHLLMLQWDRIEEEMRSKMHDQQKTDIRKRESENERKRAFMSAKAVKAEKEKLMRARAKMTPEERKNARVKEILERDHFDFTKPIPFRMKVDAIAKVWTERRRRFYLYDQPQRYQTEKVAYDKKVIAWELALTKEGVDPNDPQFKPPVPPKRRPLPLTFPRPVMEQLVKQGIGQLKEYHLDAKMNAAIRAVELDSDGEYYAIKVQNLAERFGYSEDRERRSYFERLVRTSGDEAPIIVKDITEERKRRLRKGRKQSTVPGAAGGLFSKNTGEEGEEDSQEASTPDVFTPKPLVTEVSESEMQEELRKLDSDLKRIQSAATFDRSLRAKNQAKKKLAERRATNSRLRFMSIEVE